MVALIVAREGARPRAPENVLSLKVYFRLQVGYVLGSDNDGLRGRDPSLNRPVSPDDY